MKLTIKNLALISFSLFFSISISATEPPYFEEIQKRATLGEASFQFMLGNIYFDQGEMHDFKQAFQWYKKSAEQGHVLAQFSLAAMYLNGEGISQDHTQALKWFNMSAEQGYVLAQYAMASIYTVGDGIPQDFEQAFDWYKKAAVRGHIESQYSLAALYYKGKGTSQDSSAAYAFAYVAALDGYEKAIELKDRIASELSGEQLEKGEALAKEIINKIEENKKRDIN